MCKQVFEVGDKVIVDRRYVGTVTEVLRPNNNVVVRYGRNTRTFDSYGCHHFSDWQYSKVRPWTPEGQKEVEDYELARNAEGP